MASKDSAVAPKGGAMAMASKGSAQAFTIASKGSAMASKGSGRGIEGAVPWHPTMGRRPQGFNLRVCSTA